MKTNHVHGEMILCIATQFQGSELLQELAQLDCHTVLLTLEELRDAGWPIDAIGELQTMPGGMTDAQIRNTVTYLARTRKFTRILPLGIADGRIAALLREHLRIPGMGVTTARNFRDRVAMRTRAVSAGLRVPAFLPVVNEEDLQLFLDNVSAPWRLRPRCIAASEAPHIFDQPEPLWQHIAALGDRQSDFLIEQALEGKIFSAYAVSAEGKLQFQIVQGPEENAAVERAIQSAHAGLLSALGMLRGVTRSRFLHAPQSGVLYFLEVAPQPGDERIVEAIERARGINLWREWARAEVASIRGVPFRLHSA